MKDTVLLSISYLPPIQYYTKLILYKNILLEQHENYIKQSYRNRCTILSANGPLALSIPVQKLHGQKTCIRDVKIDYSLPWQKIHWRAIESAYGKSAFFLYYKDDLYPFYSSPVYSFLFDYALALMERMNQLLGIHKTYELTKTYRHEVEEADDFRYTIHPKKNKQSDDPCFSPAVYHQVFAGKYGFQPNLSIIDLLFNEGNESLSCLQRSVFNKPAST